MTWPTGLFVTTVALLSPLALSADPPKPFVDITASSGVDELLDAAYAANPKWWLSGIDLVDLDGDGKLDLFLSAHTGGPAVAALNDGAGRFVQVHGKSLPPTEIHLAYDIDEDGRLDLQMTFRDGGGKWWQSQSAVGRPDFLPTNMDLTGGQARQN